MKSCPSCNAPNQDLAPSCVSCGTAFGTLVPSWSGGAAGEVVAAVPAEPDLVGGRYRLIEQLGKGGAGVVYRAWDTKLEEDTAIKILQQSADADGAEIGRFKREITTARKITHPNVIRIHDFGESASDVFISMEILKGGTLGRRMKAGLSIADALSIAIGVCDGLQAAHALGIVHRDLKPDNILFDGEGRPKVADFGLARLQMASTRTVGFSGTPFYMSPEHANGSEVTTRSDVYSLGVVLYQLFTGRLPFLADNFLRLVTMHCNEAPPPMASIAPGVPAELERVIVRALEKDPQKRHANGGELAAELRRVRLPDDVSRDAPIRATSDLAPSLRMSGPVPMPVRDLSPSRSRSRTPVLAAVALAVTLLVAGLFGSGVLSDAPVTPTPAPTLVVAATPTAVAIVTAVETPISATPTPAPTRRVKATPVRPRATPTPAPVVKVASTGFLKVTGNAYVEVYVDGAKMGAAPYDQQIKAGAHAIRLVSPGPPARAKTQTLNVTAGTHYVLFFDVEKNEIVSQKR